MKWLKLTPLLFLLIVPCVSRADTTYYSQPDQSNAINIGSAGSPTCIPFNISPDITNSPVYISFSINLPSAFTTGMQGFINITNSGGTMIERQQFVMGGSDTFAPTSGFTFVSTTTGTALNSITSGGNAADFSYNPNAELCFGASITSGTPQVRSNGLKTQFFGYITQEQVTPEYDTSRTNIWYTSPNQGNVVSSSTPFELSVYGYDLNWTSDDVVTISYYRNEDLQAAIASPSLITTSYTLPIPNPFGNGSISFGVSTSTIFNKVGVHTLTATINRPYKVLGLNVPFLTQELDRKTVQFTVEAPSSFDTIVAGITGVTGNFGSSTASTTPADCNLLRISDCVTLLFVPNPDSLAYVQWSLIQQQLMRKPPLGYYYLVSSQLASTSSSTENYAVVPGIAAIGAILTPIRIGIAVILWFLLLVYIFKRFSHWDFQS